jgi:hypothetical protein
MIHHLSIPAAQPSHVAQVLAELLGGSVSRFGPYRDSYIAWADDEFGTAFEVLPLGTELFLDQREGYCNFRHNGAHTGFITTHAAVSVQRSKDEVIALAAREGWRAQELSRGSFRVIEFWIENRVMLEVLTADMAAEYLAATRSLRPN